jgi:hypothetical protein
MHIHDWVGFVLGLAFIPCAVGFILDRKAQAKYSAKGRYLMAAGWVVSGSIFAIIACRPPGSWMPALAIVAIAAVGCVFAGSRLRL